MSNDCRQPSFDSNEYMRPNDNWRCGGALDGLPCTRGPTVSGECGAPCIPFKIGDRFYCNNAAKLCGRCDDGPLPDGRCSHDPPECTPLKQRTGYVCNRGACVDGPLPDGTCSRKSYVCQPVRTVKAQRWLVTTSLFGAALGLALLALGGPRHQAAVSPGNVASVHQAVADNCSACHEIGDAGAVRIFEASISGRPTTAQNELCLRCHQEFKKDNLLPHTVSAEFLNRKTGEARRGDFFVEATRVACDVPDELACASCHSEHHGADNDLTEIADHQCQICHTYRFHSFAKDHPAFSDYPLSRRSEIHFNHSSHYGGHFADYVRTAPGGEAPGELTEIANASSVTCAKCHDEDDSGAYMLSLGYEASCASCHDAQIWDLSMPPMPVLSLRFPVELECPPLRPWGVGGGPFELPPIMQLLLASDDRFASAYLELQNSSWQTAKTLVKENSPQVAQMEGALKELVSALKDDLRGTISERIAAVGGDRLTPDQLRQLARSTATADFVASVQQMAKQSTEADAPAAGSETAGAASDTEPPGTVPSTDAPSTIAASERCSEEADPPVAGWSFDEQTGMLSYRPREHADSVMREWTDVAAAILSPNRFAPASTNGEAVELDAVQAAAEYFSRPIAAGRCVKCHTVDEGSDGLHVNWHAKHHAVGRDELTFFRHAPHVVMLPEEDQCITCHKLQSEMVLFRPEFFISGDRISVDASPGASCGFPQISGAVACANCHHRAGASQRCTTCHHYHARRPASSASSPGSL